MRQIAFIVALLAASVVVASAAEVAASSVTAAHHRNKDSKDNGSSSAAPQNPTTGIVGHDIQGGYDCPGKIRRIACYEDISGILTGIGLENELGAVTNYCHVTATPTKIITMADNENIVAVRACRGAYYGYTSIHVQTDSGRIISCGKGAFDYKPSGYDSYAASYQSLRYSSASTNTSPAGRRHLLSNGDDMSAAALGNATETDADHSRDISAAGVSAASTSGVTSAKAGNGTVNAAHLKDGLSDEQRKARREQKKASKKLKRDFNRYFKQHHGWGWKSLCMLYTSPKQPVWYEKDWHKHRDHWGYDANSKYAHSWTSYSQYYSTPANTSSNGKEVRYLKSYQDYKLQARKYARTQSLGYEPQYYYSQVYPLSNFLASCDSNGNVYDIYGFCWNKAYVPLTPINDLPVELSAVQSEEDSTCPADTALPTVATAIAEAALQVLPLAAESIYVSNTTSAKCVPGDPTKGINTTITISAKIVPAAGTDLAGLKEALTNADPPVLNTNLCSYDVCPEELHIYKLTVKTTTNMAALRSQLVTRPVRSRLARMTTKISRVASEKPSSG